MRDRSERLSCETVVK